MQHFFKIKILIHSTSFTFTNQTHTCLYFNKLSNLIIFTNYQIKCKSISGIFKEKLAVILLVLITKSNKKIGIIKPKTTINYGLL